MRGAGDLAGRGAELAGQLALVYIVIVQVALFENGIRCMAVLIALALAVAVKARAERDGVDRADGNALAARDALVCGYLRAEVGVRHGVCVQTVYLPETGAGTAAAVADKRRIILALDLERAVDKPGFLGVIEHADGFIARDVMAAPGADIVIRGLVKLETGVLYRVLAALADELCRRAAGAVGHGIALGVVDESQHVLIGIDLLLGVYLFHHGRDLHQSPALHADVAQQHAEFIERAAELESYLGVLLCLRVRHYELIEAGDERGDVVKALAVGGDALKARAFLAHMLEHFCRFIHWHLRVCRDLLDRRGLVRDMYAQLALLLGYEQTEHLHKRRAVVHRAEKQPAVKADIGGELRPCTSCHLIFPP